MRREYRNAVPAPGRVPGTDPHGTCRSAVSAADRRTIASRGAGSLPLGAARPRRRHGRLGADVRAGQGRGRDLSALRLPGRALRDREPRARRAGGAAAALARPQRRRRRDRARPPARHGLRAPDGRARADDGVERRLHHRALRRLHAAPRAPPLPDARRRGRLARRRAWRSSGSACSPESAPAIASATRSSSPARPRTRSRSS